MPTIQERERREEPVDVGTIDVTIVSWAMITSWILKRKRVAIFIIMKNAPMKTMD